MHSENVVIAVRVRYLVRVSLGLMRLRAALISEPYQLHQGPSSLEDVVQGAVSVGLDPSVMLYSFLLILLTLATVRNVAVSIRVHISFQMSVFISFGKITQEWN